MSDGFNEIECDSAEEAQQKINAMFERMKAKDAEKERCTEEAKALSDRLLEVLTAYQQEQEGLSIFEVQRIVCPALFAVVTNMTMFACDAAKEQNKRKDGDPQGLLEFFTKEMLSLYHAGTQTTLTAFHDRFVQVKEDKEAE